MISQRCISAAVMSAAIAAAATGAAAAQTQTGQAEPVQAEEGALANFGRLVGNLTQSVAGAQDPVAAQSAFFFKYAAARLEMNEAQMHLSEAFELRDQISLLQAERATLTAGSLTAEQFRKSVQLAAGAQSAFTERMTSEATLTAEATASFVSAIPPLVRGTALMIQLPREAEAWVAAAREAANSGSMLEKARLLLTVREAVSVARDLPSFIQTTVASYRRVLEFGRARQVQVPPEAEAALEAGAV
jgi:hypothetical protein